MRKNYFSLAVALTLASSIMFTSCIGSFTMTKRLLSWNNQVGNKFVNELVFFAFWILPVYEVSALADVLVLNSIEFWSGTNPLAQSKKTIEGKDGKYLVETNKNGYIITSEKDGSVTKLNFNEEEQTWSIITADGNEYPLLTFVDDMHVKMPTNNGDWIEVELSRQGVMAYSEIATSGIFAFQKDK